MIKKTAERSVETWNQILTPKLLQELSDKKSGISQIDVKTISINNDNLTNIKTSKFPDFKNDKTVVVEGTGRTRKATSYNKGEKDHAEHITRHRYAKRFHRRSPRHQRSRRHRPSSQSQNRELRRDSAVHQGHP